MTTKTANSVMESTGGAKKAAPNGGSLAQAAEQWTEARLAYPLYAALATQFNFAPLPHAAGELPPTRPTRSVFERDLKWLDSIDEQLRAYQIRQLPPETLNASEGALRAFTKRQLRKPEKVTTDRDKIDLLLVQYFALCAPEELCRQESKLSDVARILKPVLPEASATPPEWCGQLGNIIEDLARCHSLRDMMEDGLLEQGRLLKESAGPRFYEPGALTAFCRFNFLLRRAFIRLLHADLSAAREAVEALDMLGVKTVDCRRAGFSAAETTVRLRQFCQTWRQPFQKDYTESSVSRAFEQLLALRADLEEARGSASTAAEEIFPNTGELASFFAPEGEIGASATKATEASKSVAARPSSGEKREEKPAKNGRAADAAVAPPVAPSTPPRAKAPAPAAEAPSKPAAVPPGKPKTAIPQAQPTGSAETDKCLETIWEQLIAAPPSRGRSMSTVVLRDTKVLLSSWEVTAFVSEGSQESEDLRRAVVARALLAVGIDERKRSGNSNELASALVLARREVSYFQGRVEHAKQSKNTEAAVNLGISTKRLLAFIEEADKLHP